MQIYTLNNGLTVIAHCDPSLKNGVVSVLYKIGSAHELEANTGLAHFLEHMMFEGSINYPDFDESLQEMMGENNAFTTQDHTIYYQTVPSQHILEILKIEADRLTYLNLDQEDIDNQIDVILEEFKETSLNPPLADAWHFLQSLCFQNSYKWPVIGSELSHISKIKRDIVVDFYNKYYSPENIIISIVSELDEDVIINEISKIYSDIEKGINQLPIVSNESDKNIGSNRLVRKNISSPHFFLAIHIDDYGTKDYFIADIVSDILTNGESSILYSSLITEKKLCTEIVSYTTDNKACNLLIIEGKLNQNKNFEEVYVEIQNLFNELIENGISDLKFETAFNKALTYWAFYHYNSQQLAQNMAIFHYALGSVDPRDHIKSIYKSIKKSEIDSYLTNFRLENFSKLEYIIK